MKKQINKQFSIQKRILQNIKHFYNKYTIVNKSNKKSELKIKFQSLDAIECVKFANQQFELKMLTCIICNKKITNILLMIIHLEAHHNLQYRIANYQIFENVLIVVPEQKYEKSKRNIRNRVCKHRKAYLKYQNLIKFITEKLIKKRTNIGRIYYHSTDIFRQLQNSADQESEQDLIDPIQQAQKQRIYEFQDVNELEKSFYIIWNKFMKKLKTKKSEIAFSKNDMYYYVKQFIHEYNVLPLRLSFILHLNTLWSHGLIDAQQVARLALELDQKKSEKL